MKKLVLLSMAVVLILLNCSNEIKESPVVEESTSNANFDRDKFNAYWNQGKAEMSSYDISVGRYGEMREGKAVLIFVTEPFSKSKKVKLDNPDAAGKDATDVLKLNQSIKFNTGLYPYSIMSSTFTPYGYKGMKNTLKSTTSIQEWCGHVFVQYTKEKQDYSMDLKSYFESEGDFTATVEEGILEEEIWNQLRIDPKEIQIGEQKIIPSAVHNRFQHIETKAQKAIITKVVINENYGRLEIDYPEINRKLKIKYGITFPYEIESWEETYESGWGAGRKTLTSTGKLIKREMIDYWTKNHNADDYLRKEFGLD